MFHFFKKTEYIHDCFISEENSHLLDFSPIKKATNFHPSWWKKLPIKATIDGNAGDFATMKTCSGYVELYKKSYVIPLWSEFKIDIIDFEIFNWQFADRKTVAKPHPRPQFAGFADNYIHLKFESPWFIKSKHGVQWLYHQPTYNTLPNNKFHIPPGIFNFKYQIETNLQILFDANNRKTINLDVNEPMVMLTPLTENPIKFVNHVVTKNELFSLQNKNTQILFFTNNYRKTTEKKKEKESKCPFHRSK